MNGNMIKRLLLAVVILLTLMGIGLAGDLKTRLTTLEWPPYISQNIDGQGYVAEVVKGAFKEAGYSDASFVFLEWTETVRLAQVGKADGYFPEYYSATLEKDFEFSDAMPGGALVLAKLKEVSLAYTGKVEELKPFKLGVVAGYINTEEIDSADYLTKVEAESDSVNLKNLFSKKVDVIVIDQLVADMLLSEGLFSKFAGKVEILAPVLEVKPLYVAFSKSSPNMPGVKDDFNKGLASLAASGKMDAILKKHGLEGKVGVE
ncbi:polar amino acid transport system substrate-binding protein [Desulfatibacillum alkenivorans DSM 16219]|uniref:Polar amino acid transport system substrate-binding protein n=1 Tax=Desulfatibacillum alkenivorans DSM 16219 TaxID=1121393 RepID=A0A1M6SRM3_9BACT|nr:transporter substrate-binding domain-containing protein [Desulfatibacillum alkenivorans]SHK47287.1 polar amino acid transport system substrate-binding protein [Desulfatibacillum alkenivorans DSM 16219]